jgi:hypothetical protein
VRIWVKIDPPHPLEAIEWGGPADETRKTELAWHSRCGTIKMPPCSKVLSADHRQPFSGDGDVSI